MGRTAAAMRKDRERVADTKRIHATDSARDRVIEAASEMAEWWFSGGGDQLEWIYYTGKVAERMYTLNELQSNAVGGTKK